MKPSRSFSWATVSRIIAALFGGYLYTYAFTAAIAQMLPLEPRDALVVATLPAFVIYPLTILWAFAYPRPRMVWASAGLALPLLLIGFWPQFLRAVA